MSDPATTAGERWRLASETIRSGFAVKVLAAHITWMLGDNDWERPVWRERKVPPDGKAFETPSFDQYLLMPAREGLGMPSLLTVHKLCEADPSHGAKAIALMEREITDYRARIKADERQVQDALPDLVKQGVIGRGRSDRVDNVNSKTEGGNSADYLAARLKRDAPDEWDSYMGGEHKSIRAAALAAGIVKPPNAFKELRKWWRKATDEERAEFENWIAEWRRT